MKKHSVNCVCKGTNMIEEIDSFMVNGVILTGIRKIECVYGDLLVNQEKEIVPTKLEDYEF